MRYADRISPLVPATRFASYGRFESAEARSAKAESRDPAFRTLCCASPRVGHERRKRLASLRPRLQLSFYLPLFLSRVGPLQHLLRQQFDTRGAAAVAQRMPRRDGKMWRCIQIDQEPVEIFRRDHPTARCVARERERLRKR